MPKQYTYSGDNDFCPEPEAMMTDEELDAMRFEGIVIPHEIAFDNNLNIIDKFILMYIGMYKDIKYSDYELGKMFNTNPSVIGSSIKRLLDLHYIIQVPDDKYLRVLKTNCSWQYVDVEI
nr:MAG TPA: Transcriptional regulator, multiple antibiotic resistance protein.04A [Bacteriophage sp.]